MNKDVDFNAVGNLLFSLRNKSNLTQQQLADSLGVTKGAICQWEAGSGIKTEKLYDIARYFSISVSELISGQLDSEDDEEFLNRNYDLDEFDEFEEIDEKNYHEVLLYLQRCQTILKRVMYLYPKYMNRELNKKQLHEFNYLIDTFQQDEDYLDAIGCTFSDELDSVVEYLNKKGITKPNELDFELQKIYSFHFKFSLSNLLSLPFAEEAANILLGIISKYNLETFMMAAGSNSELRDSLMFKRILLSGARIIMADSSPFHMNRIPKDSVAFLEGKRGQDLARNKVIKDITNKMHDTNNRNIKIPWKNHTLESYENLVDYPETEKLRNYYLLRDIDPKTSLLRLEEIDFSYLK